MPWHLDDANADCDGWAVVKDSDGSIAGCHPTKDEAMAQMAALYANEPGASMADRIAIPEPRLLRATAPQREQRLRHMEVRKNEDGSSTVFGYASVFDEPYTVEDWLGEYEEVVRAGAFERTLEQNADPRMYIDHEGIPIARVSSGNLQIREDDHGLYYEARLDPRQFVVNDLLIALERGDMREASFAFQVAGEQGQKWNDDYTKRELLELKLFDVSVVGFPANPATSAGLRAAAMRWLEEADREELSAVGGEVRAKLRSIAWRQVGEEDEPAEEAEEVSDLEVLQQQLQAALDLVTGMIAEEEEDVPAPGMMEGEGGEQREGKVLSAANMQKLSDVVATLQELIAAAEPQRDAGRTLELNKAVVELARRRRRLDRHHGSGAAG